MNEQNQRELYKSAFSRLHASGALEWEEMNMTTKKKTGFRCRRSMAILAAVLTVLFAMSAIAYAATDGEIVQQVKIWINGQQIDAGACTQEDGSIVVDLKDSDSVRIEGYDWSVESETENFKGNLKVSEGGSEGEVTIEEPSGTSEEQR